MNFLMMRSKVFSLRLKFTIMAITIGLVSFGVAGFLSNQWIAKALNKQYKEKAMLVRTHIIRGLESAMESGARGEISELLNVYRAYQGIEEVRIFDLKGHEVFSEQQGPDETRVQEMVRTGEIIYFDKETNGGPAASFLIPITNKPECQRCHDKREALRGGLLLSLSLKEMKQDVALYKQKFYLLFVFMAVVISAATIITVKRLFLAPLKQIQEGVESIGKGDFRYQIPVASNDEIGELARTFNRMSSQLKERSTELQRAYDKLKEETEERSKVEQQLRQAQKMEAVGTLAGGIAHDFNNVLAAIIGFSELALGKLPEGSPVRLHMERIFTAGIRGRDLVKQILAFSRQAEQTKLPIKLAPIVKETLRLLRASLPSTIGIRMNLPNNMGFVSADPIQIQQVIMNLCTNAAHSMREKGGSISIDLADFSVSSPDNAPDPAMRPGSYARLSVQDTGVGMSPETIEHIFDPFFTTKAAGEGTGLGLSVVHGIVASHGGTITVSSEPGKGSTFTIYLPKLLEEQPRHSGKGGSSIPRGHERILFIDDEENLAALGHEMLTDLGYAVTFRTGARESLALFRLDPSRFDLVIADQTMPNLTGVELAKEILAIRADMPIIMCTGFSYAVDADSARAAGIKAFAMKPLTKREIAKTVRKVLDE